MATDDELPNRRCIDLEYLLLSLPRSTWVVRLEGTEVATGTETGADPAATSLGEDLPGGGRTRLGKFRGRRRL